MAHNQKHIDIVKQAFDLKLIKGPQLMLLVLLNASNLGWRMVDIVRMTGMSSPTAGMCRNKLLKGELVEMTYPWRDQRTVRVYLTEAGREKAERMWEALQALSKLRGKILPEDAIEI